MDATEAMYELGKTAVMSPGKKAFGLLSLFASVSVYGPSSTTNNGKATVNG